MLQVNLALFVAERGPREALAEATFSSAGYDRLEQIVDEFSQDKNYIVQTACLGVAGRRRTGEITNLSWVIDALLLAQRLGLEGVYLLNLSNRTTGVRVKRGPCRLE